MYTKVVYYKTVVVLEETFSKQMKIPQRYAFSIVFEGDLSYIVVIIRQANEKNIKILLIINAGVIVKVIQGIKKSELSWQLSHETSSLNENVKRRVYNPAGTSRPLAVFANHPQTGDMF